MRFTSENVFLIHRFGGVGAGVFLCGLVVLLFFNWGVLQIHVCLVPKRN